MCFEILLEHILIILQILTYTRSNLFAEIRMLLLLAEFCVLADELWSHAIDRTTNLLECELMI